MLFDCDVDADKIRESWSERFKGDYPDGAAVKRAIDAYNAGMRDIKEGGSIVQDFVGDTVNVMVNGATTVSIEGRVFQRVLLSIWPVQHPPNEELERGMLGG